MHLLKTFKTSVLLLFILSIFLINACSSDSQPEPTLPACIDDNITYDNQIEPLIATYCNSPDCHNSGSPFGDYTSYQLMESILNENLFENRVIDLPVGNSSKMPPPNAIISEITATDLEIIECWIAGGYLEN